MFRIQDGHRILQFEGEEIGFSTSHRHNSERWIEFTLYKTSEEEKYVLSRVGFSKIYHLPECEIAERSRLDESPATEITDSDIPCRECRPDTSDFPLVSFEREKHWARVYSDTSGLIEGLMKVDPKTGDRHMTSVARRLLDDAATVDDALYEATNVEVVR